MGDVLAYPLPPAQRPPRRRRSTRSGTPPTRVPLKRVLLVRGLPDILEDLDPPRGRNTQVIRIRVKCPIVVTSMGPIPENVRATEITLSNDPVPKISSSPRPARPGRSARSASAGRRRRARRSRRYPVGRPRGPRLSERRVQRDGERGLPAHEVLPRELLSFPSSLHGELQTRRRDGEDVRLAVEVELALQLFLELRGHRLTISNPDPGRRSRPGSRAPSAAPPTPRRCRAIPRSPSPRGPA